MKLEDNHRPVEDQPIQPTKVWWAPPHLTILTSHDTQGKSNFANLAEFVDALGHYHAPS